MSKYFLTNQAVIDLEEIWEYTFNKWSEKQADIYYKELIESFNIIVKDPASGKNYEGIVPSLFGFKVNKHIVFYRTLDHSIEITRILHERMDLIERL